MAGDRSLATLGNENTTSCFRLDFLRKTTPVYTRMKRTILLPIFAFTLINVVSAQISDTEEQLIKRFGTPQETKEEGEYLFNNHDSFWLFRLYGDASVKNNDRVKLSEGEGKAIVSGVKRFVFNQGGLIITAWLLDGKCVAINYKPNNSDTEKLFEPGVQSIYKTLFDLNKGGSSWPSDSEALITGKKVVVREWDNRPKDPFFARLDGLVYAGIYSHAPIFFVKNWPEILNKAVKQYLADVANGENTKKASVIAALTNPEGGSLKDSSSSDNVSEAKRTPFSEMLAKYSANGRVAQSSTSLDKGTVYYITPVKILQVGEDFVLVSKDRGLPWAVIIFDRQDALSSLQLSQGSSFQAIARFDAFNVVPMADGASQRLPFFSCLGLHDLNTGAFINTEKK